MTEPLPLSLTEMHTAIKALAVAVNALDAQTGHRDAAAVRSAFSVVAALASS